MLILDAGHRYLLDSIDGGEPQTLQFVKRAGVGFPFNSGESPGTNCQEVLRALIDRTDYLLRQIPCAETEAAVAALKTALFLFESRAARRHGRTLDFRDLHEAVRLAPCRTCGHLCCGGHACAE
jgi:hypothetical protein